MGAMIVVTAAIHLWLIFVPHKDDDGKEHHLMAPPRSLRSLLPEGARPGLGAAPRPAVAP